MTLPMIAPLEMTGEEGRRRAIQELSDPLYRGQEPSLLDRFVAWLDEMLGRLVVAGDGVISGWVWALIILVVLLVLIVALTVFLRPSRSRRAGAPVHEGAVLSAADHRAASDRHETAGEFAEAVTERLRAISVDLEERTIVSPRPGRTATELADEASLTLPGEAEALREGTRIFNDVAYGDRPATAESARTLRELDVRLAAARPANPGATNVEEERR
ncbi:DUF4129 domain-containing protein [Nocardiopsis alba]|uniref:DUF4129 domain-containing protein n=1 Tax=Nocardiopsis alba TaxID=53437 RepID=UPI00366BA599